MNSRGVLLQVSCALLWLLPGCSSPQTVPDKGESVFVVHGLGRTPASMRVLVSRIEDAGYHVINFGYPSTAEPIEELTALLGAPTANAISAYFNLAFPILALFSTPAAMYATPASNPRLAGRVL